GGGGVCDDRSRDAALQVSEQPVAAVRPEHDQTRTVFVSGLDDALPGWRRLYGLAAGQESGLAGQRCPVSGSLFGGIAYLGGPVGVEVSPIGGCEPHLDG